VRAAKPGQAGSRAAFRRSAPFLAAATLAAAVLASGGCQGPGASAGSGAAADADPGVRVAQRLATEAPSLAQEARSPLGMVVSAKPLASQVGALVLEEGGNAMDAAVAAALALTVVEPAMSSIGGRTQVLVRTPDGVVEAVDGGNEVVAFFNPALMPNSPDPTMGYGTVAIPGTVAGLAAALERHGTWSLAQVLAPAIALAEGGFVLTEGQGERWEAAAPYFSLYPGSAAHFLRPDGSPYRGGERFRQPVLAETLRTLAREGPSSFYRGSLAAAIHGDVQSNGGFLTEADLAAYRALDARVVRGTYGDREVVGSDLPASGAWVVRILEILEEMQSAAQVETGAAPPVGSPGWVGLLADALVQGFEERDRAWEAGTTLAGAGLPGAEPDLEPAHTTHLSAADARGMVVALTQSIGPSFGSHVANPDLGFLYASTQGYLATEPGSRPFSSMSPLLVLSGGEPEWVIGGAGARRIISAMVAVLSRGIDGGLPLAEAMAAPRFHAQGPRDIRVEDRPAAAWGPEAILALESLGFQVSVSSEPGFFARLHVIQRDGASGDWVGVADPRRVGAAAPQSPR
jgi:gamma-glutamyltranspeptidase/glutathione hydrolase